MKNIKSLFKKVLKPITFIVIAVFLVGLLSGIALERKVIKSQLDDVKSSMARNRTPDIFANMQRERRESSVKRAKDQVKKDLESKLVTQEQADAITKKIEEVYKSAKDADGDIVSRSKLRLDIQQWVSEQKVSMKYFIGVY